MLPRSLLWLHHQLCNYRIRKLVFEIQNLLFGWSVGTSSGIMCEEIYWRNPFYLQRMRTWPGLYSQCSLSRTLVNKSWWLWGSPWGYLFWRQTRAKVIDSLSLHAGGDTQAQGSFKSVAIAIVMWYLILFRSLNYWTFSKIFLLLSNERE